MDKPTLSIVMPIFNHADLVIKMWNSIQQNDYQEWELLAVDDGSSDDVFETLAAYAKKDSRINYKKRDMEPKGAQTCRNIGMELAQGEYVVFFDSDDYVTPYCLRQRVESLRMNPDQDFMVFPSGCYVGGKFSDWGAYIFGYPIYEDDLQAFIRRTLPFIVWNNIYRLDSLRKHCIRWDVNILSFQDSDFNIQALLHGLHYKYATIQPDYGYRTEGNAGSISKKIVSESHRKSHLYFIEKQYKEVQKEYGNRYNKALYQCAMFIFSCVMSTGIDRVYARQIAAIVSEYDRRRGRMLYMKISVCQVFSVAISPKWARRLSMPFDILNRWWMERWQRRCIKNKWKQRHYND